MSLSSVTLKPGPYILVRERDGAGDSGPSLQSIRLNPESGEIETLSNGTLHVGYRIKCGSISARSFSYQDWWMTTELKSFLEISDNYDSVRFETVNGSVYIAKCVSSSTSSEN